MWKIALFTLLINVTWGVSKPSEPLEGPFWSPNTYQLPQTLQTTLPGFLQQRLQVLKENERDFVLRGMERPQEKRAFSILARLRPFTDIGKQRTSIRKVASLTPFEDFDIVSAETRAMLRPMGQPLRWG